MASTIGLMLSSCIIELAKTNQIETPMEMVTEEYRGFVITYPRVRIDSARWTVNLSSNDRHFHSNLDKGNEVFADHRSLQGAIRQAKDRADQLLERRANDTGSSTS